MTNDFDRFSNDDVISNDDGRPTTNLLSENHRKIKIFDKHSMNGIHTFDVVIRVERRSK